MHIKPLVSILILAYASSGTPAEQRTDASIPAPSADHHQRMREIGVQRFYFGSDAASPPNLVPRDAWALFRKLPLTLAEFTTIANNVAPYLR